MTTFTNNKSNTAYFKTGGATILTAVSTIQIDTSSTVLVTHGYSSFSSFYTHELSLKVGTETFVLLSGGSYLKGSGFKTAGLLPEVKDSILLAMRTSNKIEATLSLTTYKDGVKVGEPSTITAVIQTSENRSAPTFTDFTYRDGGVADTVEITGNDQFIIQDSSYVIVTVEGASGTNHANITSYQATIGSHTVRSKTNVIEFGEITESGNVSVMVEVIDSRGYTASMTKTIEVIPYSTISITDYSIRRTNEVEPSVVLSFSGNISPIGISGEDRNRIDSCSLRYRTGTNSWSAKTMLDVSTSGSGFTFETSALSDSEGVIQFDPNLQYTILLEIEDRLSSDRITLTLNKGLPLLAYRSKMIGINEPNPQAALHISGEGDLLRLNEKTLDEYLLDKFYPIGSIYVSMNSADPADLFGGEWERIQNRFLWGCDKVIPAGSLGGEMEHLLTANEMPKHAHNAGVDGSQGITATKGGSTSAIVYFEAKNGTVSTSAAGNNYPHNNMPPYYAVYMWQRMK